MKDETIEVLARRYKKSGYSIAKIYSKNEELEYYSKIADILVANYGSFISKEDILKTLSSRGKIITSYMKRLAGFFEKKTGNICINHFLNRITTTLLHESVHKLGYEKGDISFFRMNSVFREAGAEFVAAKALSEGKYGREFVFPSLWSKLPEKVDSDFLEVNLVNQLNELVGGNCLEESMLNGTDKFSPALIKKYGEGNFVCLKERLEDIYRLNEEYKKNNLRTDTKIKDSITAFIKYKVLNFQDYLLKLEFEERFQKVDSLGEGKKFLEELLDFGENRIKVQSESESGKRCFIDIELKKFFTEYKSKIEEKYGETGIEFEEDSWKKKYPEKEILREVSEEEKREILHLSIDFNKNLISHSSKKAGKITKILESIFGIKKRPQIADSKIDTENRIENYKIDYKIGYSSPENNILSKSEKAQMAQKNDDEQK